MAEKEASEFLKAHTDFISIPEIEWGACHGTAYSRAILHDVPVHILNEDILDAINFMTRDTSKER